MKKKNNRGWLSIFKNNEKHNDDVEVVVDHAAILYGYRKNVNILGIILLFFVFTLGYIIYLALVTAKII